MPIINISVTVDAPVAKVWAAYNTPEDIQQWNQASPDWHCPASVVDLREGGRFKNTMAAKDGSFSFDFSGLYTKVIVDQLIEFVLDDNRKVSVQFDDKGSQTIVSTEFEAENQNPEEMQREGWLAILTSFKNHVERK